MDVDHYVVGLVMASLVEDFVAAGSAGDIAAHFA